MIYVMSDIHGNLRRFRSVMDQLLLRPEDTLYVIGDVIDRHPCGIEILETIMETPNIKMLLGNHELMMLNALYQYKTGLPWYIDPGFKNMSIWFSNGGEVTKKAFDMLPKEKRNRIFDFLKALPVYLDIKVAHKNGEEENFKLVHAAPPEFFGGVGDWKYPDETYFAVWKRGLDFMLLPKTYTLIMGHTPTAYYSDKQVMSIYRFRNYPVIDIDCGSALDDKASGEYPYQGRLGCLRLDDMKEFYSTE